MAANGAPDSFAPDTILAAMATMRGGEAEKKKAAMDYLGKFQKSVRIDLARSRRCFWSALVRCFQDSDHSCALQKDAWSTTLNILQSSAEPEATLFAATTLKGKVQLSATVSCGFPSEPAPI